jgi:N-acetylglucosaminyl-diphospho-decaprenol L-rhamnosyltransferase
MATASDLDIVVLNWRTADMSADCAQSAAKAAPGAALYVVDNGSGDGSPAELRKRLPQATVVETGRNLGFGAGMNAGVRAGSRPFVLILNSDARAKGDAFMRMLELCASDARIGVVTPMTVDESNQPVSQLPPEPAPWELVVCMLPLVGKLVSGKRFFPTSGPPQTLSWMPTLCVALFRREAFERINGFDPRYFLGWEEWDVARRLANAGYTVSLHRSAEVIHAGHGSTPKTLSSWRAKHGREAICYHLRKYHGPSWYALGRIASGLATLRNLQAARLGGQSAEGQ